MKNSRNIFLCYVTVNDFGVVVEKSISTTAIAANLVCLFYPLFVIRLYLHSMQTHYAFIHIRMWKCLASVFHWVRVCQLQAHNSVMQRFVRVHTSVDAHRELLILFNWIGRFTEHAACLLLLLMFFFQISLARKTTN